MLLTYGQKATYVVAAKKRAMLDYAIKHIVIMGTSSIYKALETCKLVVLIVTHVPIDDLPFGKSAMHNGISSCIQKVPSESSGHDAYFAKISGTLQYLKHSKGHRLYLLMDAFDTYFRHNASTIMERFYSINAAVVVSSEIAFTHQPQEWKHAFDSRSTSESRYLNTGMVMGYGNAILRIMNASAGSAYLKVEKKRGTDQTSIADVLVNLGFSYFNTQLDYSQQLFYTASGRRWSLKISNDDINRYDPTIVHFPFTSAPRVRRTFYASYDGECGMPWPEVDMAFCKKQEQDCAKTMNGPYCHVGGGHRPGMNRLAC